MGTNDWGGTFEMELVFANYYFIGICASCFACFTAMFDVFVVFVVFAVFAVNADFCLLIAFFLDDEEDSLD